MAEAAAKEPSMEEILSSIRKIIAEESTSEDEDTNASEMKMETEPVVPDMPEDKGSSVDGDMPQTAESEVEEPELEAVPAIVDAAPVDENPSGSQAAETARSLAAIAEDIKSDQAPVAVANSLANIAASIDPPKSAAGSDSTDLAEEVSPVEDNAPPEPAEIENSNDMESIPRPVKESTSSEMDEAEAFRGALMSPSADGAVTGSFDRLKRSAMDDLDAKTEAVLRPMLREWLDENLPTLVEKLVRREIERVARGQ